MRLQSTCGQEGQQYPGVHQEESGQQVEGGDFDPLGILFGILCSVLVSTFQEIQEATGEDLVNATKTVWVLKSLSHEERLWELCLFSPEKRRLGGDHFNIYKYLKGSCQEGGARLLSEVPSGMMGSNGHDLKHEKSA